MSQVSAILDFPWTILLIIFERKILEKMSAQELWRNIRRTYLQSFEALSLMAFILLKIEPKAVFGNRHFKFLHVL